MSPAACSSSDDKGGKVNLTFPPQQVDACTLDRVQDMYLFHGLRVMNAGGRVGDDQQIFLQGLLASGEVGSFVGTGRRNGRPDGGSQK